MTALLASVKSVAEMDAARDGGADIVDLKDPARGALGAWDEGDLLQAVAHWPGPRRLLSATAGDLPMTAEALAAGVARIAASGVDIVKVGLFPSDRTAGCVAALAARAARVRLVAVLFADLGPDLALVDDLANARFHGAMIDTARKDGGGLREHLEDAVLAGFVAAARRRGLITGLAGSLCVADIPALVALGPDYLGFRGALCRGGRAGMIDVEAVRAVREAITAASGTPPIPVSHLGHARA